MIGTVPAVILIQILSLTVLVPAARAANPEPTEREVMYHRYLDFASYVKG